jgi:hypothetical protein
MPSIYALGQVVMVAGVWLVVMSLIAAARR